MAIFSRIRQMIVPRNTAEFVHQVVAMMHGEGRAMLLLAVCSLAVAFTEGLGITILLPLFDTQKSLTIPFLDGPLALINRLDVASRLYVIAAILGVLLLIRAASIYAAQHLALAVPSRISRHISHRLHDAYLNSSLYFAGKKNTGELHNLIVIAPERAVKVLKGLVQIIVMLPLVAIAMAVMLAMSWQIALFSIAVFGTLYFGIRGLLSGKSRELGRQMTVSDKALSQTLVESVRMFVPTKLMNAHRHMSQQLDDRYARFVHCRISLNKINAAISPLISIGAGVAIICILIGIASFSVNPAEEIPRLLVLIVAMSRLPGPTSALGAARMQILSNLHAFREIEAFLAAAAAARETGGFLPPAKVDTIEFDNVGFVYSDNHDYAARHLSFQISRGTMVALVGPSGAGKTTVMNLLARLYCPTEGRILVNGADITELDPGEWRNRLGVVVQEMSLFNGSIRDNIAFHRMDIGDDEVRDAARLAGVSSFVEALPLGYDTPVGEGVRGLSGGQRQRLMIARALAGGSEVLILDEATSSLDTESEAAVQSAIQNLRGKVTIVWVSHRMHTVRGADVIFVMDKGRIVAAGTHVELLQHSADYQALVRTETGGHPAPTMPMIE
jgi:ABC-type multidrug transport system fused ATPase/permease subunit